MKNIEYKEIEDDNYKAGGLHTFKTGKECSILGVYRKYVNGKSQDIFVKVSMLLTGYETYIPRRQMDIATGYDPYEPRIAGVGYIGEGGYQSRIGNDKKKTPQYRCWENLMYRVYGEHRLSNRYRGRGVTVCEEWHNYQNFAKWFDENYIDGFVLEKDILCTGALQYNPENCVFVPQELNKFFAAMNESRGDSPVGTTKHTKSYTVRINKYNTLSGKVDHHSESRYKTAEDAFAIYKFWKELSLKAMAHDMLESGKIGEDVHAALLDWRAVPYPE